MGQGRGGAGEGVVGVGVAGGEDQGNEKWRWGLRVLRS